MCRWQTLGPASVPALLAHPDWAAGPVAPLVLWMHGRTIDKEFDPGRYLRWLRAGLAVCAVDLPGHGQRAVPALQQAERMLDVVLQMAGEIDSVLTALDQMQAFDMQRLALGGISGGGLAALIRLCRPHPFRCAVIEATSGSWPHLADDPMFRGRSAEEISRYDPIEHLDGWREIPVQILHARQDEIVPVEGQVAFVEALRARYQQPALIEFILYDRTGAPREHAGFGRKTADARARQRAFLVKSLGPVATEQSASSSGRGR